MTFSNWSSQVFKYKWTQLELVNKCTTFMFKLWVWPFGRVRRVHNIAQKVPKMLESMFFSEDFHTVHSSNSGLFS